MDMKSTKTAKAVLFFLMNLFLISNVYSQEYFVKSQNVIRYDVKTKVPRAIYNVNSRQYTGTPEQIAKQYLVENSSLLSIKNDLTDLIIDEVKENPAGYHVGFKQEYKGIPVFRSETVVSINHQNKISMLINGHKPNISVDVNPNIGGEQVIQLAKEIIGVTKYAEVHPSKSALVVYEDSISNYHLAWKVIISPEGPSGTKTILIDAHDGKTLEIIGIFGYVNGTGRVYDPDPATYYNNYLLTDHHDSNHVSLNAYKINVTLNDLNDAVGGRYYLRGKYAWSVDTLAPRDPVVYKIGSTNFDFTRNQNGFEEVNIYYHVDKQRRYVGSLGFKPIWNFAGIDSAIAFDARGLTRSAAYYNEIYEYMYFGVPSDSVDAGEDESVIIHEYGHALHDALIYGGLDGYNKDTEGISEGLADYLSISYRRKIQSTPYRPNARFNWCQPNTGVGIKPVSEASYPGYDYWGSLGAYMKMPIWASTLMDIEYNTATDPSAGTNLGRDVTTKLVLASLCYVTSSDTVIDNVNAILQADRDIYNGSHLSALATVFYNRGFFIEDQVSGPITSNTTWSGNKYVTGNVTVNSGVTLTILPNTFVFFPSGASLIVNGTLNANGITDSTSITFDFVSPNSLTNNGIKLNSGSAGSTISFCKIINADRGIYENGVNVNITYSAFSNCTNGIYLYSSSPTIRYCNIYNNSYAGVYTIYYSSPSIKNNYIKNNSQYGIYCTTNSSPILGDGSLSDGNSIKTNSYGVFCWNSSSPTLTGGRNNLVNTNYNIYNMSSTSVTATYNWWGSTTPANFKIAGTGGVSYANYLLNENLSINPIPPLSKSTSEIYSESCNDIPLLSELNKVNQLIAERNLVEARGICLELINNYPDYSVSYNALNLLKETYVSDDVENIKSIYETLFNSKEKKDIYAMAGLILSDIDKENRLKHIEEVISIYAGESVIELALFDKFVYYNFEKNDKEKARTVSKELDELFPLSIGAIEAHRILGDEKYFSIYPEEQIIKKNTQSTTPTVYALYDNYPNPFNPTTTINFQIPKDGYVTLKVYDVLGREVASLVNEERKAGSYSCSFDASKLSSGVYIYKITANGFVQSKKMLLMK